MGVLLIIEGGRKIILWKFHLVLTVSFLGFSGFICAQEAAVFLRGGSGGTGEVVQSHLTLDVTFVCQGWSMGICHDTANL